MRASVACTSKIEHFVECWAVPMPRRRALLRRVIIRVDQENGARGRIGQHVDAVLGRVVDQVVELQCGALFPARPKGE